MKERNRFLTYRLLGIEVFLEPQSRHWFYCFGYDWVVYRSNGGYPQLVQAEREAKLHVDRILAGVGGAR